MCEHQGAPAGMSVYCLAGTSTAQFAEIVLWQKTDI